MQPHGRIVIAGRSHNASANLGCGSLMRYNPDGARDRGFGTGGSAVACMSSGGTGFDGLALQADGTILVAGVVIEANADFAVARYLGHLRDHIFEDGFDADVTTVAEPGT